jgi:predicted transcriptional regulator
MVIAEPTAELLLAENRQRLIRELLPQIRRYEDRYEIQSESLAAALADGRIADTEEICDWVIAWETYRALTASGSPQLG